MRRILTPRQAKTMSWLTASLYGVAVIGAVLALCGVLTLIFG